MPYEPVIAKRTPYAAGYIIIAMLVNASTPPVTPATFSEEVNLAISASKIPCQLSAVTLYKIATDSTKK